MSDLSLVIRAASFAAHAHRNQRRKGGDKAPYINHPLGVAAYIVEVGFVHEGEVLAAAILHDVVEDTETTLAEIADRFGKRVAGYVSEVSDDKELPKAERKQLQIDHAPGMTWGAKLIKLADKIYNCTGLATTAPAAWPEERIIAYLDWAEKVVAALGGVNTAMEELFAETLEKERAALSEKVN